MGFLDLDLTLNVSKMDLFLARPDKTIIANLNEAFNVNHSIKLGGINELTFSIMYDIEISHNLLRNPNIDLIKDRYLVKTLINGIEEWYIINKISDVFDDNGDSKQVNCMLLPYEMSSKTLHVISRDGVNLSSVLSGGYSTDENGFVSQYAGILNNTRWSLGYVDSKFDITFRTVSFSSVTVLDALLQVAQTFQAIIVWDTVQRKISFLLPENVGTNKGLTLSYGRYLKTLSREVNSDEMVTRLKIFGANDLTINSVNPTGQNYIEDLSYFMYPFKRDVSRNILSHSDYMTDALCHAILDYQILIDSYKDQFTGYSNQQSYYNIVLSEKGYERTALELELTVINSRIDTQNSISADTTALVASKAVKTAEITAKKAEIVVVQTSLATLDTQVATLRATIDGTKYFSTRGLLEELNDYIIEKEWTDTNYTNPMDLYNDGIIKFQSMKVPQVVVNISMINFLEIVDCQLDWGKLNIGDTITMFYEKMNINIESKIIEISTNGESGDITLTIANTKDILTDEQKLIQLLYNSATTSATLEIGKNKWDSVTAVGSKIDQVINNAWDANKLAITGGINNSVTFDNRGLLIKNSTDPLNYLVANNAILAITNDGGNTWKNAITKDGIVGERVYGKILAGVNLIIDASDATGTRTFIVDNNGVTITGGKLTITGGLPKSQLDPTYKDGLLVMGSLYNGLVIDSTNGIIVTRSDTIIRTVLNATDGFKFQKNTGTVSAPVWSDRLYYSATTGNLTIDGEINAKELKVNGSSVLTTDKLKISGGVIDKIKIEQLDVTTAKITTAMIENLVVGTNVTMGASATISWATQVTGKPTIPATAADIGALSATSSRIQNLNTSGFYTGSLTESQVTTSLGNRLTNINSNGVYTGVVDAGLIVAQTGVINQAYIGDLDAGKITTGSLSANFISGGSITSSAINVTSDLRVGSNIYLANGSNQKIAFLDGIGDNASITNYTLGGNLTVKAITDITLNAPNIYFPVNGNFVNVGDTIYHKITAMSSQVLGMQWFNNYVEFWKDGVYKGRINLV